MVIRLANQEPAPLKGTLRIGASRIDGAWMAPTRALHIIRRERVKRRRIVQRQMWTYAALPDPCLREFTEAGRLAGARGAGRRGGARPWMGVAKPRLPALGADGGRCARGGATVKRGWRPR